MAKTTRPGEFWTDEDYERLFSEKVFSVEVVHAFEGGSILSRISQDLATFESEVLPSCQQPQCRSRGSVTTQTGTKSMLGGEIVGKAPEEERSTILYMHIYIPKILPSPFSRTVILRAFILSFLKQSDSWSRIHMSREALASLTAARLVSDDIYDFIRAFGFRVRDSDTNFGGYFRRTHRDIQGAFPTSDCQPGDPDLSSRDGCHVDTWNSSSGGPLSAAIRTEFCFSVRYPARHGRNLEDPWVMRRILVYQQYQHRTKDSTWIFLQCPPKIRNNFLDAVSSLQWPHVSSSSLEEAQLHILILSEVFQGWRDYINHLETVIEELGEVACFSRVGRPHPFDYDAKFADAQLLQQYIRILLKARDAVKTSGSVVNGLGAYVKQLGQGEEETGDLGDRPRCITTHFTIELFDKLEHLTQQLGLHERSLTTLAEYSQQLQTLLLSLLNYRNEEITHRNGEIAHHERAKLQRIASCTQSTSQEQYELLRCTVRDYRVMKTLTYVTMLYLPANLIAALFSSNLLSSPSTTQSSPPTPRAETIHVSKSIWLFFLLSLALTALTILVTLPWNVILAALGVVLRWWRRWWRQQRCSGWQ